MRRYPILKRCGAMKTMNEKLLELFEQSDGDFVSGEKLSTRLHISRTAIWKHIQQLREQGYRFEAVQRKGYRMIDKPDKLDINRFLEKLTTERLGRNIKYYDEVDSTNAVAHTLVAEGAPEGTLVFAEKQTAGRGRMGRKWHSPKGKGIWMSLVLKPAIPLSFAPQLTLLIAVALSRAISSFLSLEVGIKWPNDLLIGGRKVCGILLESSAENESLQHVIVGMGIDANLQQDDYPDDLHKVATSLAIESVQQVDRTELMCHLMKEIEQLYLLYLDKGFAPIKLLWEALTISLGRPIRCQTSQGVFEGIAEGIDDAGALLLRLSDGSIKKMYSADIEFR